ncbi:anti-anti-sigma factor [Anoxybacillus vitaminiphilus]|uniref:Anti-sigma factor antagonist n=1 Tax=Paranoxybacillus vitaminiphilus TaxID=581036 RepID=A0A327YDV7_9BACL|nr:STAS domain-containing protein [Anoxybacillus vitaminiphilus]RAK19143.1 anti-anti-sigma factor [Anoxybacillus vitaminiphilus]
MEKLIKNKHHNPTIEISYEKKENYTKIYLKGKLVYGNQQMAKDKLRAIFEENKKSKHYVFDMNEMEFIDSTGLALLIYFFKMVQQHDGTMTLVVNNPVIQRIIKIAKLDLVMAIVKDEKEINEQC